MKNSSLHPSPSNAAVEDAADVATTRERLDDLASGKTRLVSGRELRRRLAVATKAKKKLRKPVVNHWNKFGSAEAFAAYVKAEWLTIGQDGGAFYLTLDVEWAIKRLKKEGWPMRRTGRVETMPDDSVRTFVCPMPA